MCRVAVSETNKNGQLSHKKTNLRSTLRVASTVVVQATQTEVRTMKRSRTEVRRKAVAVPELKFESQSLTSFSGLVIWQQFLASIGLRRRLEQSLRHLSTGKIYTPATIFLQLILHVLLGFRELRDCQYYADDPLVQRVLGLKQLPDVATVSRMLTDADERSVVNLRRHLRALVQDRLRVAALPRVTLDFDGSVLSTGRFAEGTAVGFNRKKKGARSYYPLFATIAQTGQVFDFHHRPGNVHDSNGAKQFILQCIAEVRRVLPRAIIEVRMDSAFFDDDIVFALDKERVELSVSVPFERFTELKTMIESRKRWYDLNAETDYFETSWKPASWDRRFRFLFLRTRRKRQRKGPVQLDLFLPHEFGYDFKVIVTNKTSDAARVVAFHEGRGSQEAIFAELKSHCHMDYVAVRRLHGNQTYMLATLFAHNLVRELQMQISVPSRSTTWKRKALWVFEKMDTLRHKLILRAGRLTEPEGRLTLTISANTFIKRNFLRVIQALHPVA